MKVVLTDRTFPFPDFEKNELAKHGHVLIDGQGKSPEQTAALVADADAVLTQFAQITPAVISVMRKCRVIVRYGIGVDNVNLDAARAQGIPVSNVPDYCIDEVADHTLALMLALTRGVVNNSSHIKSGVWGLAWRARGGIVSDADRGAGSIRRHPCPLERTLAGCGKKSFSWGGVSTWRAAGVTCDRS